MGRIGSIEKLPPRTREKLAADVRDPGVTQAEAAERTNRALADDGSGERISRDAVGRYDRRMRTVGRKLLESRQVAEVWIAKLGSQPGGQTGHLITEMLRTLVFEVTLRLQEDELTPDNVPQVVSALKQLSLSAARLERASAENVKREREISRAAAEELAAAADKAGSGGAVTPEQLRDLVRGIYGV